MKSDEIYKKYFEDEEYDLSDSPDVTYSYQAGWNSGLKRASSIIAMNNCGNCKYYIPYGSRADGYCNISRMTICGMVQINVSEDFYCKDFEEV